jgi:MFS-type transporter involved in bile tolerance (Atg22 family)
VALHTACRLALIAFATVALRGVLDGSEFQIVLILAIKIGVAFFGFGMIIGELARRLLGNMVISKIKKLSTKTQLRTITNNSVLNPERRRSRV